MKKRQEKTYLFSKERLKDLDVCDIKLIKWTAVFATLFIIGILAYWIEPLSIINFIIKYRWMAFVLMIIFMIRPLKKYFSCKCNNENEKTKK